MTATYYHSPELPWSPALAEERRFRLISAITLLLFIAFCLVMATIKVPPLGRGEAESIPPRLARLVIPEKPQPPPPPEPVKPEAEKKPEVPKPETKAETAPPPARVQAAREKAARSGLLALKSELSSLQKNTLSDLLDAKPLTHSATQDSNPRSMITSAATAGSGGINTTQFGRDAGETRLAARDTTQVESALAQAEDKNVKKDGRKTGRSTEQVKLVLDQNKGAIYALYHRALRADPSLQGKVVLEISIAPSGDVSECKVVSSEIKDEDLIRKLVARVKLFQFGAKAVDPAVFTWPIDFLPSS